MKKKMGILDRDEKDIISVLRSFVKLTSSIDSINNKTSRVFVENLSFEHRTTQQLVIKLFANIITDYGNCRFDLRNEDAIAFSRKVRKINQKFRYI